MLEPSKVQDQLTRVTEYWETKKELGKLSTPEREKLLGLKYTKGTKVLDSETGEEVEVIGGTREIIGISDTGSSGP